MKNLHVTTRLLKLDREELDIVNYKATYLSSLDDLLILAKDIRNIVFHGGVNIKINDSGMIIKPILNSTLKIQYIEKAQKLVVSNEKKIINKYIVALATGGLMESPKVYYENFQIIEAENKDEAKEIYDKKNNCNYFWGKVICKYDETNNVHKSLIKQSSVSCDFVDSLIRGV